MKKVVSRRTALHSLGVGAGTVTLLPWLSEAGVEAFAAVQRAAPAPAPRVLTRPQLAALDALVEAIIPADDRSPGAREARVAAYIDLLLEESDTTLRQQWIEGLAAMEQEATTRFNAPIAKLSAPQLEQLLTDASRNERQPQTPVERFFVMTKLAAITGYYTSEIGIHKDLRYKGNQALLEFHGCLAEEGKDCPHCGQKAATPASAAAAR